MRALSRYVMAGVWLASAAWLSPALSAAGLVSGGGKTVNAAGAACSLPGVTVGNDPARLLAVTIGAEFPTQQDEVTSVSFAGEPLTLAIQEHQTISSASIWYLVNPPATTASIEVTFSDDPNGLEATICHYTLCGVDPANPVAMTMGSGSNSTLNASQTLPGLPNAVIVIDAVTTNNTTTPFTWGSGQTEGFADGDLGRGTATHASSYETGLSGAQTQTATWTNINRAVHVSAAFSTPATIFFTTPDTVVVPAGTVGAIHTVNASDPTGGNVSYTKMGGDSASFNLHPTTGNLAFASPLAAGTYDLTVTATSDGAGGSVPQSLTIIVNDAVPTVTDGAITVSGATGTAGAFIAGDTVTVSWDNSASGDNNDGILSATADLSAFGGPADQTATENAGIWTATYPLPVGTIDITTAQVSVTATNSIGPTTTLDSTSHVVDSEPPVVSAANLLLPTTGSSPFTNGDTITMRWTDAGGDDNTDTIETVQFDFTALGGSLVAGAETSGGSRIWEASYTVAFDSTRGSGLGASVTATDNAGNTTTATAATTVNITTGDVLVGTVTGSADEADPATLATYDLALDTTPAGPVEITVTADSETEVSSDGTNFSGAVSINLSDTTPQTISVRAVDDSTAEGPHLSALTHAVTATADAANYPLAFPIPGQSVAVQDNDTAVGQHNLPITAGPGRLTSTFTHTGPADPAMLVVGFAGEDGSAGSAVSKVVVTIDGVPTELTNSVYEGNFDTLGHVGLWFEQLPALPPGTHTVTFTTNADPARTGANVWVLPGTPTIRDMEVVTYLDDDNGGPGTGGIAGWVGFNGVETLTRSASTPSDVLDTEDGDFVLAMAMSGDEGEDYIGATQGWTAFQKDILFQSGNYSVLHGPVSGDDAMLGLDISSGYTRYGIAALSIELEEVIPAGEPFLVEQGFDGSGNFIIDAYNLDPAKTYVLKRSTDLLTFPDQIETSVTGVTQATFTDTDPPAGFSFYKLEEVETPPTPVGDPTLVLTGVSPEGHMLFEANNLDPAKTYVLKRGTDLITFPVQIGDPVTAVTQAFFTDTAPPGGTALYRLEEYVAPTAAPSLTTLGVAPGGAILFQADNLDPGTTYVLRRGTDLQSFPDTVDSSTGLTTASFSDPAPPPGKAFYRLFSP